ncbi:Toxic cation resistance protein [Streptomyces sp. Ru62]|nr:Toxic cation resistance protein [Streptomyces sp. Ru62]
MPAAEEHDLVAAAFDKVKTTPAQPTDNPEEPTQPTAAEKPEEPTPAGTEEPAPPKAEEEKAEVEKAEEPASARTEDEVEEKVAPSALTEAEPKAEETTEETTEAESEPETTEEPEPQPEPEAEQTTGSAAEAEAEAEVAAQAEADVEAEAHEAAAAPTAPQAADGEDAPQGPPAADDEIRTGGTGGNTDAEGEAEADTAPAPQATREADADTPPAPQATREADADTPPAPQATREADADTPPAPQATREAEANTPPAPQATREAEADTAPAPQATREADAGDQAKPANTLARIKSRTPSLTTAYKAATTTLKKTGLTGTRAKVYLVLDRSASMRPYYKDGSAQALADQTLALAAHLDPEATVHVVFFSTEVDGTTDLTLTPDHETKIDDVHAGLGRMGRTSYHAAVQAVVAHYEKNATPGTPALVVFQTDGAPDAKTPATQSLTETATSHPAVFFSFVAFGDHDNKAFDYLRKLKTGNTSFFHAGPAPRELTDTELYEGVLATWRP